MDALRLRSDAVTGGSRNAVNRGMDGSAEARRRAGVLNPAGSSEGCGHEATELRAMRACAIRSGVNSGALAPIGVRPCDSRFLNRCQGEQTSSSDRFALRGALVSLRLSPDLGEQTSSKLAGLGSGTNPPAFLGGKCWQSLKPFPVVRPSNRDKQGAGVGFRETRRCWCGIRSGSARVTHGTRQAARSFD